MLCRNHHTHGAGYNFFFFSSRRRHTRSLRDWRSDVCSSDLGVSPLSLVRIRLEKLMGKLKETLPPELLARHDDDVIWTKDSRLTGKLEASSLRATSPFFRSEERRVGKESCSQWSPCACKRSW